MEEGNSGSLLELKTKQGRFLLCCVVTLLSPMRGTVMNVNKRDKQQQTKNNKQQHIMLDSIALPCSSFCPSSIYGQLHPCTISCTCMPV